ncbi:MAG: helix-turn-helix domain-containing protein [Staphylococcus equorum]|uniref:helix-turn-helix domain-containing protein n=1 Tax=Tetragenococcus halophilus TaxID=51669 RepID=UPI001F412F02|nr:helix-turn-helix transcriptional regulator [Tetragenococcus halophilus]MCF1675974.1 helix-turn-helix domain-containing protein [Tetragenococcus halophilus]MDN6146745.1 helix-turn-helix domain-containing protein [Tetragenococcus koreensis]MDN6571291.1 helix-turn-helix domain-containing protein [Staphylococcus equorum]
MPLGDNLKKIRGSETQTAFAKKLGISRTYLSDLENGRKSPSIETVSKLAEKLEVSTVYLLYGKPTLTDMEDEKGKVPIMGLYSGSEAEVAEKARTFSFDLLENTQDYKDDDLGAITNLYKVIYTARELEESDPNRAKNVRLFMRVIYQDLNKRIKNDSDSELNKLFKEISELIN